MNEKMATGKDNFGVLFMPDFDGTAGGYKPFNNKNDLPKICLVCQTKEAKYGDFCGYCELTPVAKQLVADGKAKNSLGR